MNDFIFDSKNVIPQKTSVSTIGRLVFSVMLAFILCAGAFAQAKYKGLTYDKSAVIKNIKAGTKMSGFFVKVDTKKKIVIFFEDSTLSKNVGEYNLGRQFWIGWNDEKLDPLTIDLKSFYARINLKNTELQRTEDGTLISDLQKKAADKPKATNNTANAGTSTATYVPDAQKVDNLVFTARKHPTVVSYENLDAAVQRIKCPTSMTPENAAKKIVSSARTETEKARAIFTWIACNIVYDYDAYNRMNGGSSGGEAVTAAGAWKNRKAVCQGFTYLYIQMANAVGLKADYISGYAKNTDDYIPGQDFENHGWGVVHADGKHILFDVTWASVKNLQDLSTFNGDWFDVDPYIFIFSHMPKQDLSMAYIDDNSMNLSEFFTYFKKLPTMNPGLPRLGIDGKELYDFFKVNPTAWVPRFYKALFTEKNIRINKIPFVQTLATGKTYTFNFTYSGPAEIDGNKITSGKDYNYSPYSNYGMTIHFNNNTAIVYNTEYKLATSSSGKYFNKNNQSDVQVPLLDRSKTTNTTKNKPKAIIFFDGSKGENIPCIREAGIYFREEDNIELLLLEAGTQNNDTTTANVKTAAAKNKADGLVALSEGSTNRSLLQKYLSSAGLDINTAYLPIVVYIDSNNKFQFIDVFSSVPEIYSNISKIAKATKTKSYETKTFNIPNADTVELPTMGGGKASNQASGKAKVLISMPFLCGNKNCDELIEDILSNSSKFKNIDIVITDSKFSCDRMDAIKLYNESLKSKLGKSYNEEFANKIFAAHEKDYGFGTENYYWMAAGFRNTDLYPGLQIFYIDSTNKYRFFDCISGATAESILAKVGEIEKTAIRSANTSASGNVNIYGLPYDPNAKITGKSVEFDGAYQYFDTGVRGSPEGEHINFYVAGEGPYGCYDWKNQCWLWISNQRIRETDIDFTKFYSSIDLSKTTLNRDSTGTYVGPEKNTNVQPASTATGPKNAYGLPYDPDAVYIVLTSYKKQPLENSNAYIQRRSEDDSLIYIDTMSGNGTYDLKNQCWISSQGLDRLTAPLDLSELYESIDLAKTELYRDKDGKPLTGWKNISYKYPPTPATVSSLENDLGTSPYTTGSKNKYGLLYDQYAEINSNQKALYISSGVNASVDTGSSQIVFKDKNGNTVGKYNYKEQVWEYRKGDFAVSDMELAIFYTSISIRKTKLGRDTNGNAVVPKPEPATQRISNGRASSSNSTSSSSGSQSSAASTQTSQTASTASNVSTPSTASSSNDRNINAYGLPYDPDAVPATLSTSAQRMVGYSVQGYNKGNDRWAIISGMPSGRGTYDLVNQCWLSFSGLNNVVVDLSQLYESIDYTKTELYRDKNGNPCAGWKNIALRQPIAKEKVESLVQAAETNPDSSGPKNRYGQPYDPNAKINDMQDARFIKDGTSSSIVKRSFQIMFYDKDKKVAGRYNYVQQVWEYRKEGFSLSDAELALFYSSIDLTKTKLNRDMP